MRDWLKLVLLPAALLAAAIGGLYWLAYGFWFGKDVQDRQRAKDACGWTGAALEPHWQRVLDETSGPRSLYENLKNVVSEWTRADPQRAAKLLLAALILDTLLHFLP